MGSRPSYPPAERLALVDELHGREVPDPYRWLEDPNSEATKKWAAAQDDLWKDVVSRLPGRGALTDRVSTLMHVGTVSAPLWQGERAFFTRREPEDEHGVLYVREVDGQERALVDPKTLDPSGKTTLDAWEPNREGTRVAVQVSTGGDEESVLTVLDVATGERLDGPIDRCRYSPVDWLPGGDAFYYTRRLPLDQVPEGEGLYHRRIYLHRIGSSVDDDVCVFGDGRDKTEEPSAAVSGDGRWLVISTAHGTEPRNELWLADLHASSAERPRLVPVQVGVDARTEAQVGPDGRLYLLTDRDAPRGRLCVTDADRPQYEAWRELVASRPDANLEDYVILHNSVLLVSWSRHGVSELSTHDLATGDQLGTVQLPGRGTVSELRGGRDGREAWFTYTGWTCPPQAFRYDAGDNSVTRWPAVSTALETPDVSVRQIQCTSKDGTTVRAFLLSPTSEPDTPRPTVLYGYGGFDSSMTPEYSATALAWVEAGGRYVVANLRGGKEEGEQWHRDGMRERKQNVFDDFYAVAEHLIAEGWTTSSQLAAFGESNGGLLAGVAVTQRPDLFAAACSSRALLDMVRYEKGGRGAMWTDEYGSAANPQELDWLIGYSPYHNVRKGTAYPAVLFAVPANDTRVDPWHAEKMCAALQYATTGDGPVVLRREPDVGHPASSVSRMAGYVGDVLAYLAHHTGLTERSKPDPERVRQRGLPRAQTQRGRSSARSAPPPALDQQPRTVHVERDR